MSSTVQTGSVHAPRACVGTQVQEFVYPGATKKEGSYPLLLKAHVQYSYFEPKTEYSIWSMIKGNPMIIMMVVALTMVGTGDVPLFR